MASTNITFARSSIPQDVKSKDLELWMKWKTTKKTSDLEALLKQMDKVVHRQVLNQTGSLPTHYLELKAKALAVKAFESYDPNKGVALSTHLVNSLKPLSRANLTYSQSARIPEHQKLVAGQFITARDELEDLHGRPATSEELADHLSWNLKEVQRMENVIRSEYSDALPMATESEKGFSSIAGDIDPIVSYFYFELSPEEKLIFEHTTGYGGKQILNNAQLAKKLNIGYSQLSYKKRLLITKMKQRLGG